MPVISGELQYSPREKNALSSFADQVEIRCLREQQISAQDILSELGMVEECETDEDEIVREGFIDDLIEEIKNREKWCSGNYPFDIDGSPPVMVLRRDDSPVIELYKFLLYATNGDMKKNCTNNDVNATLLFEELSEITVKIYLGEGAETFLFGTANKDFKNFQQRITELIQRMNEGKGFKEQPKENYDYTKDDGLDVAAWIPFGDGYPGQLIVFGQCKTGTSWDNNTLTDLQPDSFCKRWFQEQPVYTPVRLFFLNEGLDRRNWYNTSTRAGIIFDRFRIMALMNKSLTKDIHNRISAWLRGWSVE